MANDIKSGVGFIIPAAGVVGFFTSLLMGEFLISIIIAVSGILVWFMYMLVMESHMPQEMGNMIMLFGVLISLGIFFSFGVSQNMWGGFELQPEGSIFSLVILFFAVLTGLNFRSQKGTDSSTINTNSGLTQQDRELVMSALNKSQPTQSKADEPKVILVKQETSNLTEEKSEEKKDISSSKTQVDDPYGIHQNPYFAYPPDYYYEDEDDDEDDEDDEYEDEWEDDEYENEE